LITISNGFYDFLINDNNKTARWVRNFEHLMGWMSVDLGPLWRWKLYFHKCNINVVYHG
jgi:hypothetical protein